VATQESIQRAAQGHGRPGGEEHYQRSRPGNPYAAGRPKGDVTLPPGQLAEALPGASTARIPTGPYNDPKDRHPGPVGPPAVIPWEATSSSEWYRTHREHPYVRDPQGNAPEQMIGQTYGMHSAPDPKWTPQPPIRTLWPPAGGQFIGRPFDQKMTRRVSGHHESMAGHYRSYQLIRGERPVHRLTTTYRVIPPSQDEQRAAERGQPALVITPEVDRSQGGTWRLP